MFYQNETFSVLIPDGEATYALSVLRCLSKNKNVKKHILSNDAWSPVRFSRYANSFTSYNKKCTPDQKIEIICDTIKKYNIDVVLPVDCSTISLLSQNRHIISPIAKLALLPDIKDINIALDKWLLAQWMDANDVRCPATHLYDAAVDYNNHSSLKFPVLLKPTKGSGGVGILVFDKPGTLQSFSNQNKSSEEYIIQSFINGFDIDCSVLCRNGEILAYTIQKGIMYSKSKISWPSGIDFFHHEETYNVVEDLIKKMSWSGVVHIDLRYDADSKKINVIEMNPRFWATVSASLFAGVNFPYVACVAALNREICKPVIKPGRVVRSGAAFKITTKKLLSRNNKDLYFDHTFLEFALKDPLPNLIGETGKLVNRFSNKKN